MEVTYAMYNLYIFFLGASIQTLMELSVHILLPPQVVMPLAAQWASTRVLLEYSSCYVALHILPAVSCQQCTMLATAHQYDCLLCRGRLCAAVSRLG